MSKPLDEAAWQAWGAKGRAHDKRGSATRMNVVKWVSIAALLAAAVLWSQLTPYEVVVRFIVAAGAIVVMVQAFQARRYAVAPCSERLYRCTTRWRPSSAFLPIGSALWW